METSRQRTAAVINPLALAELILGEPISVDNPEQLKSILEKALQVPFDELFDPIYRSLPYLLVDLDEKGQAIPRRWPETLREKPVKEIDAWLLTQEIKGYETLSYPIREQLIWILIKELPENISAVGINGITWHDPGDFYEEGTEFSDPVQGAVGDCYLIAALTAVAWARPYAILQRNRATGPGTQAFVNAIDFQNVETGVVTRVEVNEKVPCKYPGNAIIYARSSEPNEIWPAVYEKAFAKWLNLTRTGRNSPDYPGLNGGNGLWACCSLVPGLTLNRLGNANVTADYIWITLLQNCVGRRTVNPMVAHTYGSEKAAPASEPISYAGSGLAASHCYAILGLNYDLNTHQRYVVLRNPWGHNPPVPNEQTGNWQANDQTFWRTVSLRKNGVFSMLLDDFRRYFADTCVAK